MFLRSTMYGFHLFKMQLLVGQHQVVHAQRATRNACWAWYIVGTRAGTLLFLLYKGPCQRAAHVKISGLQRKPELWPGIFISDTIETAFRIVLRLNMHTFETIKSDMTTVVFTQWQALLDYIQWLRLGNAKIPDASSAAPLRNEDDHE